MRPTANQAIVIFALLVRVANFLEFDRIFTRIVLTLVLVRV
jgi:hypothetical protein